MINPLLLRHLPVSVAPVPYFVAQLCCFILVLVALWFSIRLSKRILYLPSFWALTGWMVIYTIPSIIYGNVFAEGLKSPALFFVTLCLVPSSLAGWVIFSARRCSQIDNAVSTHFEFNRSITVLCFGALLILALWLYQIPISCTAGWATIFDPERTLLARELAGKLSNTPVTSRMIGVYVDVLVPLIVFLSSFKIVVLLRKRDVFSWAGVCGLALLLCMVYLSLFLTGIKGTLLPTLIVCMIAVLLMPTSVLSKLTTICVLAFITMGAMVFFQMFTANSSMKARYDFGQCAAEFNSCDAARTLIASAAIRDRPTIVGTKLQAQILWDEMGAACGPQKAFDVSLLDAHRSFLLNATNNANTDTLLRQLENSRRDQPQKISLSGVNALEGLWIRAFQTPIQVASWYFLWDAEHIAPGWRGIPLMSRYLGEPNMTKEIYQRYGAIYSYGDYTSTSTAPSTFFLTYAAFMGVMGIALALILFIGFDYIVSLLINVMPTPLSYGFAGLSGTLGYHFLVSDFFTVIGTHGGAGVVVLMVLLLTAIGVKHSIPATGRHAL